MKPMLSAKLDNLAKVKWPILASPKLDGIRCVILNGVPVTRNLKHVPNRSVFRTLRELNLPALDGELIVGDPTHPDCYRTTNSGIMSQDGEPDWAFYVFDIYAEGAFEGRLAYAEKYVRQFKRRCPRIRLVPHEKLYDEAALLAYEQARLAEGYEGVMGRSMDGYYKQGRSTVLEGGLWKLKRFVDSEAVILGFDEQMHNANEAKKNALGRTERSSHKANKVPKGTLGAIHVRDIYSNVEFDIGTGFTDEERAEIWESRDAWLGEIVKYKSLPIGVKEKPRFPVYLGKRADL